MFVHKGGQINNVQLITGLRIAEMSQLQKCSVMCTKNGSYCENEKREKKSDGRWGCVQRMEVIVKRKKRQGGRGGGGVRVDVNGEVKLSCLYLPIFRSQASIVSKKSTGGKQSRGRKNPGTLVVILPHCSLASLTEAVNQY